METERKASIPLLILETLTIIAILVSATFSVLTYLQVRTSNRTAPSPPSYENRKNVADTAGHWAESDIQEVIDRNIMLLTGPSTFNPDSNIYVSDFKGTTDRLAKYLNVDPPPAISNYGDSVVTRSQAAAILSNFGIPRISSDRPDDFITRAELAKVITTSYL